VAYPLRTRPRPDSAGLNSRERAVIAGSALVSRAGAVSAIRRAVLSGVQIILVDDVVTTGATLATAATRLRAAGVPVTAAAVLAATRRRAGGSG
jgi:predicted amidophosphoribosyltransferase